MKKKEISNINFKNHIYQKYYVEYEINENNSIDNPTLKNNFYLLTKNKLDLSLSAISIIRNKIIDEYKNLTIENLITKIIEKDFDLENYIIDIKYEYKEKNDKINTRKQKIILFGLKENFLLLDKTKTEEFFIDGTFKIIPAKYRPYKLIVLAGLPNNENKPKLICLILMKFLDAISYDKLFNYLCENFNFLPKYIHSDYEKALHLAIKNNKYLKKEVLHIKCLFHFSQMIKRKLFNIGICKKKLNKKAIEILRNIEIICFLEPKNIKKQKEIILEKLDNKEVYIPFIKYLKSYLFKLDYSLYNYYEFINIKNDINNKRCNDKIYLTNNICESINAKINYYLPKKLTSNIDFVNCINKLFINSKFNDSDIIRHDYVTKSLIKLIKDNKLDDHPKWVSYKDYMEVHKAFIKVNSNFINDNEIDKFINIIYYYYIPK